MYDTMIEDNFFEVVGMENSLVVKSNDLIEAKYELSILEQKIILYAVSKLDRNAENFTMVQIRVQEVTDSIDSSVRRYTEFREIAKGLRCKSVKLADQPDLDVGWVASSNYMGDGIIQLEFSQTLIPYLLQLKERFTRYQLKNILYLKNKYSIRIYELLKQYENMATDYREFDLDKLKDILMLGDKHSDFRNFERRVLKPATEEINQHTDIRVSYDKLKLGRKITGIRFEVMYADKQYVKFLEQTYDIKDLRRRMGLNNENLSSKQVIELYSIAVDKVQDKVDVFSYVLLNYKHMLNQGTARNKFAYMKKALENDYAKAYVQLKFGYIVEK